MKLKRILALLVALLMLLLSGCADATDALLDELLSSADYQTIDDLPVDTTLAGDPADTSAEAPSDTEPEAIDRHAPSADLPAYGEYYYDLKNVVLYLQLYGELPDNYITKNEARELGWEGGSVEEYLEGAAIGGDSFGNREGLLPTAAGRRYTECDIDTNGTSSRGSRRLVFSNDGLYFYTADHYESFSEVTVTADYEVIW